jgi:hypothetical protein
MVKLGVYEHYKGGHYRVVGIASLEDTEDPVVIYEALYDNNVSKLWARSVESFEESVVVDNAERPRFKFIAEHGT